MTLDDLALLFQARHNQKHEQANALEALMSAKRSQDQAQERYDRLTNALVATEARITKALK